MWDIGNQVSLCWLCYEERGIEMCKFVGWGGVGVQGCVMFSWDKEKGWRLDNEFFE